VRDEEFSSSAFFDARDLVQVKYEMVRKVETGEPTSSPTRCSTMPQDSSPPIRSSGRALLPTRCTSASGCRCTRVRSSAPWRAGRSPGAPKVPEPVGDPDDLVTNYEILRQAVLCEEPCGWRLGHGVLTGRGVAAWMAAWTTVASAPEAETTAPDPSVPSTTSPPNNSSAALSSLPGAKEIVAVLAQMALAHS
jgi:hypothetical protein